MPVFTYVARDRAGQQLSGTVSADSDTLAAAQLREQGLWVTDLKSAAATGEIRPRADRSAVRRIASPVRKIELANFYRQLHTLLNSGISLYNSLELLSNPRQQPNHALQRVVADLCSGVLAGQTLSQGMHRYPWLFDRMQLRMVEAGETGGMLAEIARRLADYLEREHEIRQEVSRRTIYPKCVLGLLVLVYPISMPLTLAGYLGGLFSLLLLILGAGIPAWLVLRLYATSEGGRATLDQVKMAFPGIGKVVRKLAAARFARTLAALYGAGVALPAAVEMSAEASGNHLLERAARKMVPALQAGTPLHRVLESTGFFPPIFLGMVATGETTGNLDGMLDKVAEAYDSESVHAMAQMVVILGVGVLIAVAIMVLFKLISFYVGMVGSAFEAAGGIGE